MGLIISFMKRFSVKISSRLRRIFFWLHDLIFGYRGLFNQFPLVAYRYQFFPRIQNGFFSEVIKASRHRKKLLLVYIHSRDSNSSRICNEILSNEQFVKYVDNNVLFWGIDALDYDAYHPISLLQKPLPHFGLYSHNDFSNNIITSGNMEVSCISDYGVDNNVEFVLDDLMRQQAVYKVIFEKKQQEDLLQHQQNRILIEEQKLRYDEIIRIDAERDKLRRQKEEEAKRESDLQMKVQSDIDEIEKCLPQEPEKGPDALRFIFKLKDGSRIERRFHKDDTASTLYNFIATKERSFDFQLITTFPNQVIPKDMEPLEGSGLAQKMIISEEPY